MIEEGVVRRIRGDRAEVEVQPTTAEACASCGGCVETAGGRILEIPAGPGIEPGRRVTLDVTAPGELGPAVVVFLLPVVAIVAGAVLGALIPAWTGWTVLSSAGFGFLGSILLLVPALLLIRGYDRRVDERASRPRVVRIHS